MTDYIFLFVSALLSFIIKGITGFGNSLVMSSLFSFVIPNSQITPVDLLISIPTNAYMTWRERKSINFKEVMKLACLVFIGVIPGTFLLKVGNDRLLKSIFGIVITGMAAEIWLRRSAQKKTSSKIRLVVTGVTSGILAGMFGIGALLVSYVGRTAENRNNFRGVLCCVFFLENIFRFVLYCATGLFTKDVISLTLIIAPAVAIGLFAGFKIDSVIKKEETITKMVVVLLAASGITLFIRNMFFY